MSSPEKKRNTTTEKLPVVLPNNLLLRCFARVSRLHHLTLSLASKSFGSILASPEFTATRNLLGRTETSLYVCLRFPHEPNPLWFTLCWKPNPTPHLSGYALTRIPVLNSPPTQLSKLVACGSNIYNIGDKTHSSSVSILDCTSHTWREAPSMSEIRKSPSVIVFDGKIYVIGGCVNYKSPSRIEVFDPKTKTWEPALILVAVDFKSSVVIDGKNYVFNGFTFEDASWNGVRRFTYDGKRERFCYCEIENVVYCYYDENEYKWYDTKERFWRNLKGLEKMPDIPKYSSVKVANYRGQMVVLWDEFMSCCGFDDRVFRCAVISLNKRSEDEIWGRIEWLNGVLTVPKTYEFVGAFATTV